MTGRRLVAPEQFREALFWGREATAGLILERGLAIETNHAGGSDGPRLRPARDG
jgi:hypothetical protein